MKSTFRDWLGAILAVAANFVAGFLPMLTGPLLQAWFPGADWRDTGAASITLYGGALLAGLGLQIYVLVRSIKALRSNQTNRAATVVALVLSGSGALLLASPVLLALLGSLLPR